jgi:hypothetical protein
MENEICVRIENEEKNNEEVCVWFTRNGEKNIDDIDMGSLTLADSNLKAFPYRGGKTEITVSWREMALVVSALTAVGHEVMIRDN